MKRFSYLLSLMGLIVSGLTVSSCGGINEGYPDEIIFEKTGGKIELKCPDKIWLYGLSLYGTGETQLDEEVFPDSIKLRNSWLEVKGRVGDDKIILTAAANTDKPEALHLLIFADINKMAEIQVKRKR